MEVLSHLALDFIQGLLVVVGLGPEVAVFRAVGPEAMHVYYPHPLHRILSCNSDHHTPGITQLSDKLQYVQIDLQLAEDLIYMDILYNQRKTQYSA